MIGLMDCNNFFVSCERLFRPDLKGKPVAVLSSNDGCIVARSEEVKDIGIPMGAPLFSVRDVCRKQGVTLFSSNFPLYRDVSARVMYALKRQVGDIEVYSIDEAFFNIADDAGEDMLLGIRAAILRDTGIPISIGSGSTKTRAKVASKYAKRSNGVFILTETKFQELASEISCGSVWGIGRETTQKLSALGIRTVADFVKQEIGYYRGVFGVTGERLYLELTGKNTDRGRGHVGETHDSYTSTRSFAHPVTDQMVLKSALGHHVGHVGEKLRRDGVVAGVITVVCAPSRYGSFALRSGSAMCVLSEPTNDTTVLLKEALRLFASLYKSGVPYKKAGFTCSSIVPTSYVSGSLFHGDEVDARKEGVYELVDTLNDRFGRGTVRPGIVTRTSEWAESKKLRSQEYTTKWEEIARVKAM